MSISSASNILLRREEFLSDYASNSNKAIKLITFDQRNENRVQRVEDRRLADEQRQQDLNISREQRENDKWIADQQRLHDKQIAADKRAADDLNAEIQRNMTRDQRMYEINVEQERYRKENEKYLDALLLSNYNEIGELFQRINRSLLSNSPTIFALARAKTLNVIEQVGPVRAAHLVKFLYGAGQLTIGEKSLDLTEAYLNNIDLRSQRTLINIYLAGAHLNNASFDGQDVSHANFRGAQLNNATFRGAICIGTIFDHAHLVAADFSFANISSATFIEVDLRRSIFYKAIGNNPRFKYARIQEANFSDVNWNFDGMGTSGFIDSNLAASNFHRANLDISRFVYCNLTRVDFTDANLRRANMTGSFMFNASFINTDIGHARLLATNLSYTNLTALRCTGTIYHISGCKLNEALTLENAHLPNKSFGLAPTPFFTYEDRPQCLHLVLGEIFSFANDSRWKLDPPHSVINQYRFLIEDYLKFNTCVFIPVNMSKSVNMVQRFSLKSYYPLIEPGRAKATVHCLVGYDTRIIIVQLDENLKPIGSKESTAYRWSELLQPKTIILQLTVEFFNPTNDTFSWFNYVELHIEADMKAPDTHLLYPWRTY